LPTKDCQLLTANCTTMPRYFLEVAYIGTLYSGFQKQDNANSIQEEIEKAFAVYFRKPVNMTGSSRTDTGVHALQNFFHFDFDEIIPQKFLYNINSILPMCIVVKNMYLMRSDAHCRFDAISREYRYYVYKKKNPFLQDRAYYFPYTVNLENLTEAAKIISGYTDFRSFSKRNTQVKSFECMIKKSEWEIKEDCLVYHVQANRFLRGMVRGLVGTMLQAGRQKISLEEFEKIIQNRDASKADFSVPGHGLFLVAVNYPNDFFNENRFVEKNKPG
jgi:tRNA pseudouridine38-40 synthase